MPEHKRNTMGSMPAEMLQVDITEIEGFDNVHEPEGILKELQERAAVLYGAEESFYLINGSTCGILSAISSTVSFGGHILMARNSHKSAYHGAYIRNLKITYLYPPMFEGYDICDAVTPKQVEEALERESDIEAVFLVSPTYEGRIADVAEIARVVHAKGIPLIVDEAHGAHLGFAEGFAPNSNQAGADLVIHSVHKTLPAMTQTALLHVNGNRIDRERLRRFLHIYQSSSPSYVLMASIDNALKIVEEQGRELFREFRFLYQSMMGKLSHCRRLRFVTDDEKRQDIGKLVIDCKETGMTGQQLYRTLLEEYHLQTEMACGSYCLAMFTMADGRQAYERMTRALLHIDAQIAFDGCGEEESLTQSEKEAMQQTATQPVEKIHQAAVAGWDMEGMADSGLSSAVSRFPLPLAAAWDMSWEQVELSAAVGRRIADFVNIYPPGVPILAPGEILAERQYLHIIENLEQGLKVQGVRGDKGNYSVKCIVEEVID